MVNNYNSKDILYFKRNLVNWNEPYDKDFFNLKSDIKTPVWSSFVSNIFDSSFTRKEWKFSFSNNQEYLAILQKSILEIRSVEFSEIVIEWFIPFIDTNLKMRTICWSGDDKLIAVSSSNSNVYILDIEIGFVMCTIPLTCISSSKTQYIPCKMQFIQERDIKLNEKMYYLFILTFDAHIFKYSISTKSDVILLHSLDLTNVHPFGTTSFIYLEEHSLILVNGSHYSSTANPDWSKRGLSVWRIVSSQPFYKQMEENGTSIYKNYWLKYFLQQWFYPSSQDKIICMVESPTFDKLVTVQKSSNLCLWSLPSMRLLNEYKLTQQMDRLNDFKSTELASNCINDIQWWSNEELIISRDSGLVSVVNCSSLSNIFGDMVGNLNHDLQLLRIKDGKILCFEWLSDAVNKYEVNKVLVKDKSYLIDSVKKGMYFLLGIKWLQQKPIALKNEDLIIKMTLIKSYTPQELYVLKIECGEYKEALELSESYNLDTDIIYLKQWKNSIADVQAINEYLVKIKNKKTILNEILTKIPHDLLAMQLMLKVALQLTDIDALSDDDLFCDEKFLNFEDDPTSFKNLDFKNMNKYQKEMYETRKILLSYEKRLNTYIEILGGLETAILTFDSNYFLEFRSKSIIQIAVNYAQNSNVNAFEKIFANYFNDVSNHLLVLISNFSETLHSSTYEQILKNIIKIICGEEEFNFPQVKHKQDWLDNVNNSKNFVEDTNNSNCDFLYDENDDFIKFKGNKFSKFELSNWFKFRSRQIENLSGLIDYSLAFLNIGIQLNISDLEDLHRDMQILYMLVYECQTVKSSFNLNDLNKLSNFQVVCLIMEKSTAEMYAKSTRNLLIPYLNKCEDKSSGSKDKLFEEFMLFMTNKDFKYVSVIFEESSIKLPCPIIPDKSVLLNLARKCIYNYNEKDNFHLIKRITKSLSEFTDEEIVKFVSKINSQIEGTELLNKYEISEPIYFINNLEDDETEVKQLITRICRSACRKSYSNPKEEFRKIISDVLALRDKIFICIGRKTCYEIFIRSLLSSGVIDNIQFARIFFPSEKNMQHPIRKAEDLLFYRLDKSVARDLVLNAGIEYYDSAINFKDEDMELARVCLRLFPANDLEIEKMLKLIESLNFLERHNIHYLPVQVRLLTNRETIIENLFKKNPLLYQNISELLELGNLLSLDESDKVIQNKIYKMVVTEAMNNGNTSSAWSACKKLIENKSGEGWLQCWQLASNDQSLIDSEKLDLLTFAISYASIDYLEEIITMISALNAQEEKLDEDFKDYLENGIKKLLSEEDNYSSTSFSPNGRNVESNVDLIEEGTTKVLDAAVSLFNYFRKR